MPVRSLYKKSSAKWFGLFTGASLWLSEDHLLSVRSLRFSEEYRRYYYRDIQALELRHAPRLWLPSWVIGLLTLLGIAALISAAIARYGFFTGCASALVLLVSLAVYRSLKQGC